MIFDRIKPIDAILATAARQPLQRTLGPFRLTMLGIGAVIGTGIFVLTAEAAQKAGPAMMISFVIAGLVCCAASLCYAELSAMVPVAGSAYTYSYAVMGELLAWIVGWALILEYALAAGAVSVGWSGYVVGLVEHAFSVNMPAALVRGPYEGGVVNIPALGIAALITSLLVVGIRQSTTINGALVVIKICALAVFVVIAVPVMRMENFTPFAPLGLGGISAAAASIFFAYAGFDAVSTAAEETRDPQRNMPIGLLASLGICTFFYLLVAAGVIGGVGAQPLTDASGKVLAAGSAALARRCAEIATVTPCSKEALAWSLREIGWPAAANLVGLAAGVALPSVILTMIYGQTRIFYVMSRDGLLPAGLSRLHVRYRTPHVITLMTGALVAAFAAFLPVGKLAEVSNAGTLFAFSAVAIAVLALRRTDPHRHRPFKVPAARLVAPLALSGCIYLFLNLAPTTKLMFLGWSLIGLAIYALYGRRRSLVGGDLAAADGAMSPAGPTGVAK